MPSWQYHKIKPKPEITWIQVTIPFSPDSLEGFTFGEIRIDNLGQDQYGNKNVQYAKKRRFFMGSVSRNVGFIAIYLNNERADAMQCDAD
jgi:hypothetical protein